MDPVSESEFWALAGFTGDTVVQEIFPADKSSSYDSSSCLLITKEAGVFARSSIAGVRRSVNANIISIFIFLSISIFSEPKNPSKKRPIGLMSRTNPVSILSQVLCSKVANAQIEGNQQHN